jgi:MFS family permease
MPVSMLYFLAVTPLTLVQVGAAISAASLVALPAGPAIGALVDRLGAKQVLLAGNALQAAGFVAYLFVESFAAVLVWTILVTVGRTAFWGSYGNIVAAIARPGERERWFGFLGALRNVGFAVGGLASGVAIAIGTDAAFAAVVAANAASYLVAFWLLLAVPDVHPAAHGHLPGTWATVLRDRPYRLLVVAQVGYSLPMMVLNFALPVYVVTLLGLPGWITGVVFTVNCVMVGFGQGLVVTGLTGRIRYRVLLAAQAAFAASYLVFLGAASLPVVLASVVVVAGTVVYTLAELMGGPVLGALAADASPDHLRGRYLSMIQLAWNLSSTVAPLLFAWLLGSGTSPLWLVMLVVAAAASLVVVRLGSVLDHAGRAVTNRAEPLVA